MSDNRRRSRWIQTDAPSACPHVRPELQALIWASTRLRDEEAHTPEKYGKRTRHQTTARTANCVAWRLSDSERRLSREFSGMGSVVRVPAPPQVARLGLRTLNGMSNPCLRQEQGCGAKRPCDFARAALNANGHMLPVDAQALANPFSSDANGSRHPQKPHAISYPLGNPHPSPPLASS